MEKITKINGIAVCNHFIERWEGRCGRDIFELPYVLKQAKRLSKNKLRSYKGMVKYRAWHGDKRVTYYQFRNIILIKRGTIFVTCLLATRTRNRDNQECSTLTKHFQR